MKQLLLYKLGSAYNTMWLLGKAMKQKVWEGMEA